MPSFITRSLNDAFDRNLKKKNKKKLRKLHKKLLAAGGNLEQKLAAGESLGTAFLKDSVARGRALEAQGERLRNRSEMQREDLSGQRRRLAAGANLQAQRDFAAVGGRDRVAGNLEQTLRRAKARQGINQRGDKALLNQQLKDRITAVQGDVRRRGQLQQSSADAARIQAGLDVAKRSASDVTNQAIAGALGSVAGGLASGFSDFFGKGDTVSPVTDQGTAAADFVSGFEFTLDPATIGTGLGGTSLDA